MPIEWDAPITENYRLDVQDFDNFPEEDFGLEIRNYLLSSHRERYYDGNLFRTIPIYDDYGNPYADDYRRDVIDIDTEINLEIAKGSFRFCCLTNFEVPSNLFGIEIENKYDILKFLFELGNNSNRIKIECISPKLKEILIGISSNNPEIDNPKSYFNHLKMLCHKFTVSELLGKNNLDDKVKSKIRKIAQDLSVSICEKEVKEYLNSGFSFEIKSFTHNYPYNKQIKINYSYSDKSETSDINFYIQTKRFSAVIPIKNLNARPTECEILFDELVKLNKIHLVSNENTSIKIILDDDENNNLRINYLTPPKHISYRADATEHSNVMGFFYTVYRNSLNDVRSDLFSRTISSDDKERIYEYHNIRELDSSSPKYTIYSIKFKDGNRTIPIARGIFEQFDISIADEKYNMIHSIVNAFHNMRITIEPLKIEEDLKKIFINPPHKKPRRLKPGNGQQYIMLKKKEKDTPEQGFQNKDSDNQVEDLYEEFRVTYNKLLETNFTEKEIKTKIMEDFKINEEQFTILYELYLEEERYGREIIKQLSPDDMKSFNIERI